MCGQDGLCSMAPGCATIYCGTIVVERLLWNDCCGTIYYGTIYYGTFYSGTNYYGTIAFDPSPSVIFIVSKSYYIPLIY